ncbi:hypothetical protein EDC94DRAFT_637615 [Helicostylum pulchrum]|nr:hypothetical protein EDC94DRAFT_637615 [Helicostylum pulchrum]
MAGKGVVRSIKNIAKGFSDVQIKVREATSNDPWGPSGTLMNEIAQLTFNESDFIEIMDMIDKRLNDKGKNWRHVFKTLKEFQHLEENGKDVGANVRQKAKDITNLLVDDNRLKEERRQRQGMRDRMANVGDYLNESVRRINGENSENSNARSWDDENELKKALAESKRIAAEEENNRRQGDDDLEKALQISQQEAFDQEKKKKESLEKENANNLFGSFSQQQPQQQFNSPMNNPYQQQQQQQQQQPQLQLEWTQPPNGFPESFQTQNNPYQQQQQQQQQVQNPYLQQPNQFNATGLQAQMTGFVSAPPPVQQQPTMDFFSQQQGLQAQMTGFPSSPQPLFQQQQNIQQQQQQPEQKFFQLPQQNSMVTGTNPFSQLNNGAQQQPSPQQQQHDYSGLVFGGNRSPQPQQQYASPVFSSATIATTPKFSFDTPIAASPSPAFANTTANSSFTSSPQPTQSDLKYAKLNALLSSKDDGMDTFGNQGNLRIPYGTGFASSSNFKPVEESNTTNKNPFGQMNQSPKPSKSLLDLMQEQKQQQQQFNSSFF